MDGVVRSFHFFLRHKALFTNHRLQCFTNELPYCKLCQRQGMEVREDNVHVFVYCPRAYELWHIVTPILRDISGIHQVPLVDLILGICYARDKHKQCLFNFVVQNAQYAIWLSRKHLQNNNEERDAFDFFKENCFRSFCRLRVFMSLDNFLAYFSPLVIRSRSVIGFRCNF